MLLCCTLPNTTWSIPSGVDAGARQRALGGDGAELDRRHVLQRADVLGHRRARAAENEEIVGSSLVSSLLISGRVPDGGGDDVADRRGAERAADVGGRLAVRPRRPRPPARSPSPRRAQPSVSSISAADRIAPIGLATFFPASGGAEPCTGSNSDVRAGMDVARGRHAEPALQRAADVGDDVAEQVVGDDHLELAGILHQEHRQRVDVEVRGGDRRDTRPPPP